MIEDKLMASIQGPSRKSIAIATAIALVVAAILLVTAVLPAEYGIAPLGTGKALHLADLGNGTFVAPSSGIHGWFWENKSGKEVTLKLLTAGFYDWVFQNRNDKETALKTMDPDSVPGHPKIPDEVLH